MSLSRVSSSSCLISEFGKNDDMLKVMRNDDWFCGRVGLYTGGEVMGEN